MQALLDDLGSADSMYRRMEETSKNAAGSAMTENEEYMKSLEARMGLARVEVEKLALAIGEAFLTEGMIQGIKMFGNVLEAISDVVKVVGALPIGLAVAGLALALLSTKFKGLTVSISQSILGLVGFRTASASSGAASATLGARLVGLGASMKTFIMSTGLAGVAFVALGYAIEKVMGVMGAQREMQEEIARENRELASSYKENGEEINLLASRYETLQDIMRTGTEKEKTEVADEYLAVQNKLAELMPNLSKGEDEYGNAVLGNAVVLENRIKLIEKQIEAEEKLQEVKDSEKEDKKVKASEEDLRMGKLGQDYQIQKFDNNVRSSFKRDEYDKEIKTYEDMAEAIVFYEKIKEDYAKSGNSIGENYTAKRIKHLESLMGKHTDFTNQYNAAEAFLASKSFENTEKIINDNNKLSDSTKDLATSITSTIATLGIETGALENIFSGITDGLDDKGQLGTFINEYTTAFSRLTKAQKDGLSTDELDNYLKAAQNSFGLVREEVLQTARDNGILKNSVEYSELEARLISYANANLTSAEFVNKLALSTGQSTEQIKAQILATSDGTMMMEDFEGATEGVTAKQYELKDAIDQMSGVAQQQIDDTETMTWQFDMLTAQLETLTIGTDEYNEVNGRLIGVKEQLLALYPHLFAADQTAEKLTYKQIEAIKQEVEANDILRAAYKASRDGKLTSDEDKAISGIETAKTEIHNINEQIKALNRLAAAYRAFSEKSMALAQDLKDAGGLDNEAEDAFIQAQKWKSFADKTDANNSGALATYKAELAGVTKTQKGFIDTLKDSEAVMGNTTTSANKLASEKQKAAKTTDKADKAQKDYNVTIKESIFLANTYKEALEKLNLEKSRLNEIKSRYPKHSKEYQDALKKELILLEQEKALNSSRGADVSAQIKSGNVRKTGIVTKGSGGTYTGKYASEVNAAAAKHGIDANLIAAVIQAESNFNPNAKSKSGAQGLMQLMPATARGLGVKDSYNAEQNIMGGAKYLAEQLKAFGGDIKLALAAYNAGPNAVKKAGGIPKNTETTNYVKKITDTLAKSAASTAKVAGQSVADYYSGNGFKATSGFGARNAPTKGASTNHKGQDFSAPAGTSIKSLRDGKVIASLYHNTAGNMVSVQQDDGTVAKYMHMQSKSKVAIGQSVKAGQEIGKVGSTGTSTGNHLHLQIEENGKAIDPVPYLKAQADATSTASQIVAETAQDIDALKSDLNQISENNYVINEKIRAVQRELIQTDLDKFNNKRTAYQNILDYEAVKMDTLDKSSQRYLATLQRNSSYLEKKQTVNKEELAYLESLIKSGKLSNIVVGEMRDRIQELTTEMLANGLAIQQTAYDEIVAEMGIYEEKIDDITYAIERSKLMQEAYDEGSADHIRETELQISLLKKHQQEIVNERDQLQQSLLAKNVSAEMAKELGEKIEDLSLSYWQLTNSIRSTEKALEESNKKMAETLANTLIDSYKSVISERRDAHMRQLESEMDAENDRHEAVMNGIDAEMDAEKDRHDQLQKSYDYQIEMEEKKHKVKMDKLQKELRAFERYIQSQIEGIDKVENTRTYDKDIDQLLKEKAEIQAAINNLAGDDSYEATAKKKDLNKQLVDVDDKIFERTNAREIELRKENYDDLLEKEKLRVETIEENENKLHEQKLDDIKELKKRDDELNENIIKNLERQKKAQEANHKANVKNIDELKRYYTQFYEDQLNNEREFARIKAEIVKGNLDELGEEFQKYMDEMIATMPELENTMNGTMQAVGTSVRQNLIDNLKEAIRLMDEFNRKKNTSTPVSSPSGGSGGSSSGGGGSSSSKLSSGDLNVLTGKFLNDVLVSAESNPARKATIKDKGHSLADSGRASGSTISSTQGFDSIVGGLSKEEQSQLGSYLKSNATGHVSSDYLKDFIKDYANKLINSSAKFAEGGNTGKWSGNGGKMAMVHPEEEILTKGETSSLGGLIPALQQIASLINPMHMSPVRPPSLAGVMSEGNIEINFNVDKMTGSKSDVDNFSQQIARRMKREKGIK